MLRIPRYTFNGITLPLRGWAKRLGIPEKALEGRLIGGWSVEKTLSTPIASWERPQKPSAKFIPPKTSYVIEGDGRFMTVRDWATELGCNKHNIYYCLRYDKPYKCKDGTRITFKRHQAFVHDGIALRACDWATRLNITEEQFLERIKAGLSEDETYKENDDKKNI